MTIEYPDYYETFRCIGGACPDTCCAGWEVDIDDETADYYLQAGGPFGERLRRHMKQEDGWYFPLTKEKRCPFLNCGNLCDIYTELGEESLCRVCTEYPRYFAGAGDYRQVDMSLSCMELGRIFFTTPGRIHYYLLENDDGGEDISREDRERLEEIIGLRCDWISLLQEEEAPLRKKLGRIFREVGIPLQGGTDEELLRVMASQEVLDHRWEETLESIREHLPLLQAWLPGEDGDGGPGQERDGLRKRYERWFTRLAVYFLFRYAIDAFADGGMEPELLLLSRSLRMIHLMCADRARRQGGRFTTEDMIDIAHIYSRQTEHSLENVEIVKQLR